MEEKSCCLSEQFQAFLEENINNFKGFKCKAAYLPNFGGCLVANQNVNEGEELLRIPESLFITLSVATNKNPFLLQVKRNLNVQKKSILAFFLFQEQNNKSGFYYQYLNAIPASYSNTITWSEMELDLLREELKNKHKKKQQKLLSEFEAIKAYLSNDQNEFKPFEQFKEGEFLQLVAMIESRTLFFKNEQDPTSDVGAMIPFYDLANHTFMEGVDHFKYFFYDNLNKEYVMRAYKNFEENEQIFITYGNYNNEHFLDYYGFIPFNNLREALQFTIQADQLATIFGRDFTKKLRENSQIATQLLSHFFTNQTIKSTIIFEVEEASQQFSWETITFLQVFSLDIDLKSGPPSTVSSTKNKIQPQLLNGKQKANKIENKQSQNKQKNSSEKSQLAKILEAFNSNQIESQNYFNQKLYLQFAQNLKKYLQEIYKNINLDKIDIFSPDTPSTTILAKQFTEREIQIINNCKI